MIPRAAPMSAPADWFDWQIALSRKHLIVPLALVGQ
jgi:hypothetical protein